MSTEPISEESILRVLTTEGSWLSIGQIVDKFCSETTPQPVRNGRFKAVLGCIQSLSKKGLIIACNPCGRKSDYCRHAVASKEVPVRRPDIDKTRLLSGGSALTTTENQALTILQKGQRRGAIKFPHKQLVRAGFESKAATEALQGLVDKGKLHRYGRRFDANI